MTKDERKEKFRTIVRGLIRAEMCQTDIGFLFGISNVTVCRWAAGKEGKNAKVPISWLAERQGKMNTVSAKVKRWVMQAEINRGLK